MGVRLSYGENNSGFEWKRECVCRGCICILHSWETVCFVEKNAIEHIWILKHNNNRLQRI